MATLVIWKQNVQDLKYEEREFNEWQWLRGWHCSNGENHGIFDGVFVLLFIAYDPNSSFPFFLAVYMIHIMMYYFTRSYSKS